MNIGIYHCWTDNNKGDLGIILSTISEIKKAKADSQVVGISCFKSSDPDYDSNHFILKQRVDELYPAIFGILNMKMLGKYSKSKLAKGAMAFIEIVRYLLILIFPKQIIPLFLFKEERETLKQIRRLDCGVSKGGSLFNDTGTLRSKFALWRMCMFYILLNKFECSYYLLGQSYGPIQGKTSEYLVNRVLKNAKKVYIREYKCVQDYKNIKFPNNTTFSSDTAFSLPIKQMEDYDKLVDFDAFNVGLTVRPMTNNHKEYIECMQTSICYLIDNYDAHIHIFPQVTGNNEPDDKMAVDIYTTLGVAYKKRLTIWNNKFEPEELKFVYGKMKLFIGTRLHSTIFAMGAGTPCIGLVYHGTKTQGIFESLNLENLVVYNINSELLIAKIEYILSNYDATTRIIKTGVNYAQECTQKAVHEILNIE